MNKKPPNDPNPSLPIEMTGVDIGAMQDPDFIMLKEIKWSVSAGEFWGTDSAGGRLLQIFW
jgi:hypothetical protein